MYLKPKEGTLVPDPVLRDCLPPEGRHVTRSAHWIRVLRDRDAEECDPPAAEAAPIALPAPMDGGDA